MLTAILEIDRQLRLLNKILIEMIKKSLMESRTIIIRLIKVGFHQVSLKWYLKYQDLSFMRVEMVKMR